MARDLAFLFPEMTLAVAVFLMIVAEMVRMPRLVLVIGLAGLALATGLTLPLLNADTTVFGGTYRIDLLAGWAKLILLPGTALTLLLARAELGGKHREGSVYALICLVTLGALMLSGVGDMMLLILGVVLTGLGSFALVAYPRDDAATEAGMKYLVFGAVTGAVMIYGLTFWFGGAGSTLFSELANMRGGPLVMVAGLVAVIVGLGYKAALVPFHFWAPDAYDGAPVSVAAFLSVITKIAAIFAFAQTFRDLPTATAWPLTIALIAAATMTYGYLVALVQTNMVRLLAYSSVAQSGYIMLGITAIGTGVISTGEMGTGEMGTNILALQSIIVFAAAYVAMNIGAFAFILVVGRNLDQFRGFGRKFPIAGVALVILLLSLSGIPPLFGFVGKALLFGATMGAGFTWLAVIGILNSVLALAVYLRIIVPMYQAPQEVSEDLSASAASASTSSNKVLLRTVWGVTAAISLFGGLGAQLFLGGI